MAEELQYPLVGLIGRARAGKDTFARGLVERGYTRVAFADPLREMVEEIDPILSGGITPGHRHREHRRLSVALVEFGGWEGIKASPFADEARRLLQQSGQAVRRIEPEFWLQAGMDKADAVINKGGSAVITDVRYENEAGAIQKSGGILVRIVRPDLVSTDTHPSETELDAYPTDFTIRNSGTADELAALARTLRF